MSQIKMNLNTILVRECSEERINGACLRLLIVCGTQMPLMMNTLMTHAFDGAYTDHQRGCILSRRASCREQKVNSCACHISTCTQCAHVLICTSHLPMHAVSSYAYHTYTFYVVCSCACHTYTLMSCAHMHMHVMSINMQIFSALSLE